MDLDYIDKHCRGIAGFLHDRYFRVDYENEERIPESGSGVLAGVHRGFMPFDGLMLMVYFHTRHRAVVRIPIHHSLHKTPVPFNFPKLGGIPAFADNIDQVIRSGQWVAMFPEGINGAFKLYKNAYQLGNFGFSELARCAIRNQVPVVPFVTIGSVEIFPILKKLQWKWFQDRTLWPAFPLAPPFPLFPVPLPTKWKTVFLDPIHAEQEYSPEDADNGEIAGRLGNEIKGRMQDKLLELRAARKSWWW
jgi:1-acyl-sn-glycerol-3-phosphate acyltransferase